MSNRRSSNNRSPFLIRRSSSRIRSNSLFSASCADRTAARETLAAVLDESLRLLHPLMPFITEELWHGLGYGGGSESIMKSAWPTARDYEVLASWGINGDVVDYIDAKHDLIRVARMLRADCGLPPGRKVKYIVKPVGESQAGRLESDRVSLAALLRAEEIRIDRGYEPERATPSRVSRLGTVYLPIEGLLDIEAEITRLTRQLEKVTDDLQRVTRKLENMDFLERAPREVVAAQESRKHELLEKSDKIKKLILTLSEHEASRQ